MHIKKKLIKKKLSFETTGKQLFRLAIEEKWLSLCQLEILEQVSDINLLKPVQELSEQDLEALCKSIEVYKEQCKFPKGKKIKLPPFVENLAMLRLKLLIPKWRRRKKRKTTKEALMERCGGEYY